VTLPFQDAFFLSFTMMGRVAVLPRMPSTGDKILNINDTEK